MDSNEKKGKEIVVLKVDDGVDQRDGCSVTGGNLLLELMTNVHRITRLITLSPRS